MLNKEFILITGVKSDLGFSTALELSKKHALLLSGRDATELNILKEKLTNPSNHLTWEIDLLESQVDFKFSSFLDENNIEIKGFIHFAGYFNITPLRLVKEKEIFNFFKINIISAIQISSVLSKKKYRKKLKNIIFISSISAIRGKPGFSVYASAKSALLGLTKNLAIELAPVHVNQLTLGAIYTKKTKNILNPIKEDLDNHIPLKIGFSNQISNWVSFLINNKDKWTTGQEIIIDGGATTL